MRSVHTRPHVSLSLSVHCSCSEDALASLIESLFVSYRDIRLNSSLRRMYYAFLTNPHFFTLEAFHQKGHAFYQFVTYLVREITSNAGSDGVVFVSLFTAALKRVPSAIRYYTHELASLAMMSESRDEVAVNRTPVEEYVRVVVLHFFDSLDEEHALPLQAVMVELLELNLKVLSAGRHIQNSEGNGARLRCWQCLCVLAKNRRVVACEEVHALFWKCVVQLNLRDVRHYIDMVGVQLLKESMISKTITRRNPSGLERSLYPLLTDVNQQTQCIPSLLVIAYYTVRDALAAHALKEYLRVVTPWMMSPTERPRNLYNFPIHSLSRLAR